MRFLVLLLPLLLAAPALRAQPETPVGGYLRRARYGPSAVAVNGQIYVVGGVTPTEVAGTIERIDPATGVSTLLEPTGLVRRFFATAQSDGPYIFSLGGEDNSLELTNVVERLDTRDLSVKTMAELPEALRSPSSAIVGGKIYVAGGATADTTRSAHLWIYDVAADKWTPGAPMLLAKECDLVARDNKLYAVAGFDGRAATRDFEVYDIAANKWEALPPLPFIMSAHHGAIVGDRLWEFGDYAEMGRVCAYNFKTGEWREVPDTGYKSRRHTAALALGGQVWIIGGNTASTNASAQEAIQRFDPTAEAVVPFG